MRLVVSLLFSAAAIALAIFSFKKGNLESALSSAVLLILAIVLLLT